MFICTFCDTAQSPVGQDTSSSICSYVPYRQTVVGSTWTDPRKCGRAAATSSKFVQFSSKLVIMLRAFVVSVSAVMNITYKPPSTGCGILSSPTESPAVAAGRTAPAVLASHLSTSIFGSTLPCHPTITSHRSVSEARTQMPRCAVRVSRVSPSPWCTRATGREGEGSSGSNMTSNRNCAKVHHPPHAGAGYKYKYSP
jgi:hypothetical protein